MTRLTGNTLGILKVRTVFFLIVVLWFKGLFTFSSFLGDHVEEALGDDPVGVRLGKSLDLI